MSEPRPLVVIGAASSAGAYGPGQEKAPAYFRRYGLLDALSRLRRVIDRGDVATARFRPDPGNPQAANVGLVRDVAGKVADAVQEALEDGHDVLVLGGDCTVELGTVAGATCGDESVGLVYIDLDSDLNTPDSADGILDWMGVAHLLDVDGVDPLLSATGTRRPLLGPDSVLLMGADNITAAEQGLIDELRIRHEPLIELSERISEVIDRTRRWAGAFERLLLHVDVDVLEYRAFPIAENTRDRTGLSIEALQVLVGQLCALPNWRGLTLTEINPEHAPEPALAFGRLVSLLVAAMEPDNMPRASRPRTDSDGERP